MIIGRQFPPLTPLTVNFQSAVFVLLVLVVMPLGAVRSKSIIAMGKLTQRGRTRPPRRSDVLTRALVVQFLLFAISFVAAG